VLAAECDASGVGEPQLLMDLTGDAPEARQAPPDAQTW
jgi:hypothetical protein